MSCGHSEKFAIAHALINTSEELSIPGAKIKRASTDCHLAISVISKMEKLSFFVKEVALVSRMEYVVVGSHSDDIAQLLVLNEQASKFSSSQGGESRRD